MEQKPLNFPFVPGFSLLDHFFNLSDVGINVFPLAVWNWEWQNTPRKDVLIAFPAGTRCKGCQKPREKVYYQEISDPIFQSSAQRYNIAKTDSNLCFSWKLSITPCCSFRHNYNICKKWGCWPVPVWVLEGAALPQKAVGGSVRGAGRLGDPSAPLCLPSIEAHGLAHATTKDLVQSKTPHNTYRCRAAALGTHGALLSRHISC